MQPWKLPESTNLRAENQISLMPAQISSNKESDHFIVQEFQEPLHEDSHNSDSKSQGRDWTKTSFRRDVAYKTVIRALKRYYTQRLKEIQADLKRTGVRGINNLVN